MRLTTLVVLLTSSAFAARVDVTGSTFTIEPGRTVWFGLASGTLNEERLSLYVSGLAEVNTAEGASFSARLQGSDSYVDLGYRDDPSVPLTDGWFQTVEGGVYKEWQMSSFAATLIGGAYPTLNVGSNAEIAITNTGLVSFAFGIPDRDIYEQVTVTRRSMTSSYGERPTYIQTEAHAPEPSTFALVALGAISYGTVRTRRRLRSSLSRSSECRS